MKTDEFFHEVFRFEADILSVLLDLKNHGKYHFDAISQKHTKKELDGIFRSSRREDPHIFLEVQGYKDNKVGWRLTRQVSMHYEMNEDEKHFIAILIVLDEKYLPRSFPLRCEEPNRLIMVKLEDLLKRLEEKAGVFTVLKPLCLQNQGELPEKSQQWSDEIRSLKLSTRKERRLFELLEYSIIQKFPKLTLKQVKHMIRLVPLEQTVAGQELIQIGEEISDKKWQGEKEQWQIEMQNLLSKQEEEKEQWQKKAEEQWQKKAEEQWQKKAEEQWQKKAEEQWKAEKRKIARRFKEIGTDIKLIAETTGLSPEEIDSL